VSITWGDFRFGDLIGEDSAHSDTVLVNMQHDSRRAFTRFVEESFEDIDTNSMGV